MYKQFIAIGSINKVYNLKIDQSINRFKISFLQPWDSNNLHG